MGKLTIVNVYYTCDVNGCAAKGEGPIPEGWRHVIVQKIIVAPQVEPGAQKDYKALVCQKCAPVLRAHFNEVLKPEREAKPEAAA